MTIERRMQALLDLVEADRRAQIDAINQEAQDQVASLLGQANRTARERLRAAFADERRQRDERVHAARARLQTRRRLNVQQRSAALLDEAWRRLPDALLARWQVSATRHEWVAHIVRQAQASLPPGAWRIRHAPDWPAQERDELAARLVREGGAAPEFCPDATIKGGLAIGTGGTVVDGTPHGLTRDRAQNGARLLAYFDATGALP